MFEFSSIEQYHAQLNSGVINCRQAVEYFLQRIDHTKHLNAFIEVYADEALHKADELDKKRNEGKSTGSLHGVVIAIKDVIAYKNHKLSASSKILENFVSVYSATAVERLLHEDAIIIGNCNCDEFAMGSTNENSVYGNVLNALNETRVPGGSSGGSAVAVQAGLCMASLGSDTGGSVRQPADFCGIVGFKPTYGRISRYGLIAYASSFDQIGIFANTVSDVAKILEVISGGDEYDSTVAHKPVGLHFSSLQKNDRDKHLPACRRQRLWPPETGRWGRDKKYRFAYFSEALDHPALDIEISSSIKKTIEDLKAAGYVAEAVAFEWLDYVVPAYYVLTTAEASSNLSRYDGVRYGYRTRKEIADITEFYKTNRSEGFGKEVKRRIMLGTFVLSTGYYDAYFTKAQQVRRLLLEKVNSIFQNYDFILMPTVPTPAFKIGEKMNDPVAMYLADIFTVMANLTGSPAISLPLYKHSNGMPFGLQLIANRFNEVSLLLASDQFMSEKEA